MAFSKLKFIKITMKIIPPKQRFSKQHKTQDISEKLISDSLWAIGLDPSMSSVKTISGGYMNANFRVDGPDGPILMKIYSKDMVVAEKERDLLEFVGRKKIKVPAVLDLIKIQDRPVAFYEYIEGQTLEDALIVGIQNYQTLFGEMGRELAKIHSITFEDKGFLGPSMTIGHEYQNFSMFSKEYILSSLSKISDNKLPRETKLKLSSLVKEKWQILLDTEPTASLCHCDFNPKNILVSSVHQTELAAVIDWEFALSGNGLIDLGNFFRFSYDYPQGAEAYFIRGYSSIRDLDNNWRDACKLIDLVNLCSFLEREESFDKTFSTARLLINNTLTHFKY